MNNPETPRSDLMKALSELDVHDHLCLIYENRDEQLAAVIPFIRMGLERGEQCVYIIDENTRQVVLEAMRKDGIDVDSAIKSGALKVLTKREVYLRDGYFDPDSMIRFLKDAVDSAKKAGFSALRVTGEMTWALGNESGVDLLIEYEAKLNYFIPKNDILAVCQYNRNKFKPEIIIDIIRTHPLVIYGFTVCKNFYYIPPDEFLKPKDQQVFLEAQRLLRNILERKRTEEAQYMLVSIVESSVDAIIGKTLEGIILSWNPGAEKLYGYSEKEAIGKPISILIPSGHFDEMPRILERIKNGEIIDHYEAVRLRKDGNQIYVFLTISPIRDADNRIIGASTIARDITEQRKMESRLRAASLYARNLIETSLDPLVTISPEGKITDVNKATESVTGLSRDELIGNDFSNYFTEPEKARKGYQEVFEKGFVRDYPLAIKHTSGKITYVLYNATVYRNEQGEVQGVFAAARDITERKRLDEQLHSASLYTRNLIETSLDPLVTISIEGKITDVNKATEYVTGLSREELIGRDFSDYFTEPENARKGYQEVFEKGFVRDYPLAIKHISGKITYVLYNASVYRNEEGEVQGVFAAARDITERKRLDEQLRSASLYTRNLIETSLDPLLTISPEGKITDVNKATEYVTGLSREELIGRDFSDYFTEPENARKGYQEVFEKGFVRDYPLAIKHISGKITYVLYNASVYRNEEGEVQGVFAAARDITERKRLDEQLRSASLYARNLIETSLDPLVTISIEGKITDVNKATESVTGFSREELIGRDFSDYFTEPENARKGYQEVFEKGFVRDYPLAIRHTSGTTIDVLYNAAVYKDATGNVAGVFAAARDITKRKRAENELRKAHNKLEIRVRGRTSELAFTNEALKAEIAQRKKAQENLTISLNEKELLIKEVHHRVKNNLQIVSSMLELQSSYMKDKQAIMAFREGQNRVSTMALIHEKLYRSGDLARIRFAEYIEELTSNVFASYGVNSDKIGLKINVGDVFFDINTAIPCGLIINELVSNSIKHAFPDGRNGEINIKLQPEADEKYLLTVSDNGKGFPSDLDFRNSSSLGLKLVITLTKQLSGTIELNRSAGTSFIIKFSEIKYKLRR
ncbi:MAG: hypothetical protein C3F06_11555 [Candidatus Methanoperedenaceae archaeon]|nr:MAG: hypothetical protein C3F06_11555 [Candidatus Methanoperedenaceae archaeon]